MRSGDRWNVLGGGRGLLMMVVVVGGGRGGRDLRPFDHGVHLMPPCCDSLWNE